MSNGTTYLVGVRVDGDARGMVRAAKEAQQAQKLLGATTVKEAEQARRGVAGINAAAQRDFARMARAREVLGVRSEKEIQREILRTQTAYSRLARSGTQTFEEQRRAARAMREEVTRLTNEMGRLTGQQRLVRAGRIGVGAAVGVGTAAALAAPAVRRSMDYDMRLAHMANTAFAERDRGGRLAGRAELDAVIRDAVRYGGGTRDTAAETADALFASGIFQVRDIKAILRDAQLAGTANNANPLDFAQMAISANQTLGIPADRMGRVFGMGTYAGQQGGFEVRDMAKWLPQQMAAAKMVGMSGESGFAKLAALNQAAVVTAGTRDEAGNNVVNLLAKLGSQDTAKDFKKQGIDLPKQLAEGRVKGLDALDVLGNLLDSQLKKDRNYQAVQKQLSGASNDADRRSALGAVGDIAQGTVIGKVFQDRQALMALYGFMNGRDRVTDIASGAPQHTDAAMRNMDVLRETAGFQMQRAAQEKEMALQSSLDKLAPVIGGISEKGADLMRQYPGYTTAIIAATGALGALATSAGALAVMGWLSRGKGAVGAAGALGAGGAGSALSGVAGLGGTVARLGKLPGMLGALGLATDLFTTSPEDIAILKRAEADRANAGNYRGKGFTDPRRLGPVPSLNERLGGAPGQAWMPADPFKGEITVRVTAAPGLSVTADTSSNSPRIPMRAAVGQTNQSAGY